MKKTVLFKDEAKAKLLKGINTLGDAVSSTLGSGGQTVIYDLDIVYPDGSVQKGITATTKDGVTVAKHISLADPVENAGCTLVKQAAQTTATKAGDGTTTSTLLAQHLINKALNTDIKSKRDYIKGLEDAKNATLKVIEELAIEVTGDILTDVAIISTNNDKELGSIIADAFNKSGEYGSVGYEKSYTTDTYAEIESGVKIAAGFADAGLINDKASRTVFLENPLIFLSTVEIASMKQIYPLIDYAIKNGRGLVLVAKLAANVSSPFVKNVAEGKMPFNLINPPSFGQHQKELMEDLADVTGAKLHTLSLGDDVDDIDESFLGTCDSIFSNARNSVLRFKEKPNLDEKIEYLQSVIKEENDNDRSRQYKTRLANIAGSIGIIHVGAATDVELKEKIDRVDDAIHAVDAAKEEGIIPGGGTALLYASIILTSKDKGEGDYALGYRDMLETIKRPYYKILENANIEVDNYVFRKNYGIDARTGETVNMLEAGIIDPSTCN